MKSLSFSIERVKKYTNALGKSLPDLQSLKSLPKVQLLSAIGESDSFLDAPQSDYEELAVLVNALDVSGDNVLDPNGEATNSLEAAEARLNSFLRALERCNRTALADNVLTDEDQGENVITRYRRAIYGTQALINVVQDKRWEILNHDAPLSQIAKFHSAQNTRVELTG